MFVFCLEIDSSFSGFLNLLRGFCNLSEILVGAKSKEKGTIKMFLNFNHFMSVKEISKDKHFNCITVDLVLFDC